MPPRTGAQLTYGTFDFGLGREQEDRAIRLHQECLIIDCLFQGPLGYDSLSGDIEERYEALWAEAGPAAARYAAFLLGYELALGIPTQAEAWRENWLGSGITGGNRQFVLGADFLEFMSYNQAVFDRFDWLTKAVRAADFKEAKQRGTAAGYLSTQDTTGIDKDVAIVDVAHRFGTRMIGLTYNSQNYVGSGCTDRADGGVSSFGAKFIKRMNEVGVIVDTAHSGPRTTLDAAALSAQPVVASHTSAAALLPHQRAKSDDELKAIAGSGGVIGIMAVPFVLAPGEGVTVQAWLDHVDYVANLVGSEHVAIGTDWPLHRPKAVLRRLGELDARIGFGPDDRIDWPTNLIGFDDYRDMPNLTRGLVSRGYSDEEIAGILGLNFLRVFEAVCG
jgi:membrane dipeptidase